MTLVTFTEADLHQDALEDPPITEPITATLRCPKCTGKIMSYDTRKERITFCGCMVQKIPLPTEV